MNDKEKQINCMFCNKTKDEVKKLFTGKNANICDECVKIAFNSKNDGKTNKLVKHHWASHIKHSSLGEKYVKVDSHSLTDDGIVNEFHVTHDGKSVTIPKNDLNKFDAIKSNIK